MILKFAKLSSFGGRGFRFWYLGSLSYHCPVSNNGFGSFSFGMVLVGHGFINYLASESFVVSFSEETENLMEEVLQFLSNR